MIKHIWFDFSGTLASLNKEKHDQLRYKTYAEVVKQPITKKLIKEFEDLSKKFPHSNSAVFHSLGLPANFWSDVINSTDPKKIYALMDERIPRLLKEIRGYVPISIFSNLKLDKILMALNIDPTWFTYIISSEMIKEPKPALDGFKKIVELSKLPANENLYIGDDVNKDILPAKEVGLISGLLWVKSKEADYSFETFDEILMLAKTLR